MAPAANRYESLVTSAWSVLVVLAFVAACLSSLMVWMVCACGGKKKEGEEPKEGEPSKRGEQSIGKSPEASAKPTTEVAAPDAKSSAKKAPELSAKSPQLNDATEARKGAGGPEMKRATVSTAVAVAGDNPAYQTLMSDSQFKATQKGGPKAARKEMEKVAGSNPAYQTIMNDSKFEASQKPNTVTATAMAAPTERQETVVKTAMAGGTTKK